MNQEKIAAAFRKATQMARRDLNADLAERLFFEWLASDDGLEEWMKFGESLGHASFTFDQFFEWVTTNASFDAFKERRIAADCEELVRLGLAVTNGQGGYRTVPLDQVDWADVKRKLA